MINILNKNKINLTKSHSDGNMKRDEEVSRLVGKEVSKKEAKCRSALLCRQENIVWNFKSLLKGKTSPQPCLVAGIKRVSVLCFAKQLRPLPAIRSPKLGEGVQSLEKDRVTNSCVSTVKNLFSYSPINLFTSKKSAFTLAEVLITLAIIGVVAAMTMPSLIAKYQQKVLASQFKKSYSNLQNAINTVNLENGVPYECYTLNGLGGGYRYSECNQFFDKFLNKFQIVNTCPRNQQNCRPKYKTKDEVLSEGGKAANVNCSYPLNESIGYNLNDGSMLYLFYIPYSAGFNSHTALFVGLDVNGPKGPNRWGYDLFYLNLNKKSLTSNVTSMTAICELIEKGGMSAEELMLK